LYAYASYSATFQLVNGSSNRIITSAWREFDNSRRYKFGINSGNGSQFTSADLNITQEVINYDDHETYWCRVSTIMAGSSSGNWSLPEVDDEVVLGLGQKFNTGDKPGLHDYSINFNLENLTAGKKPEYKIDTKYNYTGNISYYGNVTYFVRTDNNDTVNMTYVYLNVDTYEKTVDEDGNTINKLLFTDVFKVKYDAINFDSRTGGSTLKECLEVVIEHREYK